MADWTSWKSRPILADYTVPNIGAGETLYGPTSSNVTTANGKIELTPNSVSSTAVPSGYVWDALSVEITSPVTSPGSYPDCVVWFTNGTGTSTDNVIYLDASYQGNMFPRAKLTRGQKNVVLGYSTRDLMMANARRAQHGGNIANMPLKVTGLKVTNQLTLNVYSKSGWTNTADIPLRVIVRGDVLNSNEVDALNQLPFSPQIHMSVPAVQDFNAQHGFGGYFNLNSWATLPGGENQAGTKVYRRINFAYNNQAITSSQYVFSQLNALQGNTSNVVKSQNDLGYYYKESNNAFLLQEFGVNLYNAGDQALVGIKVNDTTIPNRITNGGTLISSGNNDFAYGAVSQNGQGSASSSEYDVVPSANLLGQFLAYKNGMVPVVSSATSSSIAADDLSIAQGGVQVIQG